MPNRKHRILVANLFQRFRSVAQTISRQPRDPWNSLFPRNRKQRKSSFISNTGDGERKPQPARSLVIRDVIERFSKRIVSHLRRIHGWTFVREKDIHLFRVCFRPDVWHVLIRNIKTSQDGSFTSAFTFTFFTHIPGFFNPPLMKLYPPKVKLLALFKAHGKRLAAVRRRCFHVSFLALAS